MTTKVNRIKPGPNVQLMQNKLQDVACCKTFRKTYLKNSYVARYSFYFPPLDRRTIYWAMMCQGAGNILGTAKMNVD